MKRVFLLICFYLLIIGNYCNSACDVCSEDAWETVFQDPELDKHCPVLKDFVEENGKFKVKIEIFNFTVPKRLQSNLAAALQYVNNRKSQEDLVIQVSAMNQKGFILHQSLYWDDKAQTSGFEIFPRKYMGEGFKIESEFEIIPMNNETTEKLTGLAFSKELGMVRGLDYNVEWEQMASQIRRAAEESKKTYFYKEGIESQKHVPRIQFNQPRYLYTEYGSETDLSKFDNTALLTLEHSWVNKIDESHKISTVFVEDEFGRVVYLKTLSSLELSDSEKHSSISHRFDLFNFSVGYRTVTAYEYCSLHGLFQGPTQIIPYVYDENCLSNQN